MKFWQRSRPYAGYKNSEIFNNLGFLVEINEKKKIIIIEKHTKLLFG